MYLLNFPFSKTGEALDPIAKKSSHYKDEEPMKLKSHFPKKPETPDLVPDSKINSIDFMPEKETPSAKHYSNPEDVVLPKPSSSSSYSRPTTTAKFSDDDIPPRLETEWSMAKANIPDAHKVRKLRNYVFIKTFKHIFPRI